MARMRKVLIVDDEPVLANNLRRYLETQGWMARVAGSGVEAIEACATFQPCVISLDYGLPDMTGIEALSFMRLVSASPCVMITGHAIDAIQAQDFSVVRSMVFIGSVFYIVGLILTDISYTVVDPRIRLA